MAFSMSLDGSVMRRLAKHARKHGFSNAGRGRASSRVTVDYERIAEFACAFAVERPDEFDAFVRAGVAALEVERARIVEANRVAREES